MIIIIRDINLFEIKLIIIFSSPILRYTRNLLVKFRTDANIQSETKARNICKPMKTYRFLLYKTKKTYLTILSLCVERSSANRIKEPCTV